MIRTNASKRRPQGQDGLQPLDLLLSGASSAVAVYAAGISLASEPNAWFFTYIAIAGTLLSLIAVALAKKTKWLEADTFVYLAAAVISVFGMSWLNSMSPDAIYSGPLRMAGVLSWMLAFGSFAVWRDQTMLFQAVPAVALFGLVGCYDTFRASVVYFFAFLVFQATLMSRAHGRAMLRQAKSSGVAESLEMEVMRRGPWRWMAGPEWALGSALTIVLISVVGAPILRESARGFSGLVRYTPPMPQAQQQGPTGAAATATRIGTGPNQLSDAAVLRADLFRPYYLRSFIYGSYNHGAWLARSSSTGGPGRALSSDEDPAPTERVLRTFRIEPLILAGGAVPVPGEVESIENRSSNYLPNAMGSYNLRADPPYPPLVGQARVFEGGVALTAANREIARLAPEYIEERGIPADVVELTKEVTKDAKTDYEKALAIRSEIERRAKYNLNAAAVPNNEDPVSFFLFNSKEGYCDLFASAMTLMARSAGLPARYVVGYYPFETSKDEQGRYLVRMRDAHAWCEIYFERAGWVVFDATEGAASVEGAGPGSNSDPFYKSPWFLIPFGLATLAGAAFFGLPKIKSFIAFRRSAAYAALLQKRAKEKLRSKLGRQYVAFERELRSAAQRPRGFGETILEYVGAAQAKLGHRAAPAKELGEKFAAAMYAQSEIDPSAIDSLREQVKGFRQIRRRPA